MGRPVIIVLSAAVILLVQDAPGPSGSFVRPAFGQYNPEEIAGFTRHLITRHEYYRAYAELRRLRELHPGFINPEELFTTELYLLYKGGRYDEILALKAPDAGRRIRCVHTVFALDAWIEGSLRGGARPCREEGFAENKDCAQPLSEMIIKRCLLAGLTAGKGIIPSSPGLCAYDIKKSFGDQGYRELMSYSRKQYEGLRSPALSVFAGIVPGLGYARAENRATGIIAFAVVAVGSVLTAAAVKTDNDPMALVFGLGTGVFYTGSILGGYRETLRYNRETERRIIESLTEKLDLPGDRETVMELYGLKDGKNR
ncbi:MAG TPA: hypothetical protein ENN21_00510 [Spirochaetes bacterium]|nr:hypothetical protein [Spirochaetota bacterium]